MLNIFICEDDAMHLDLIEKCIQNYILMENLAMDIVCASTSPGEVLDYLKANPKTIGMYFLDLHLGCEITGIELAAAIRAYDHVGFIVFITSDGESRKVAFQLLVEAMQYIEKGDANRDKLICECLSRANARFLEMSAPGYKTFSFKLVQDSAKPASGNEVYKGTTVAVNVQDIVYIETSGDRDHNVILHADNARYVFRETLDSIEKRLNDNRFHKCQRHMIINISRVSSFDDGSLNLHFDNGCKVSIAATHAKKLKKAIMKFGTN